MYAPHLAQRPDTAALPGRRSGETSPWKSAPRLAFATVTGVARGLLGRAAAGSIFVRTGLTAITIWAVGCVVPAPLQAEQGGPATVPRITSGDVNGQPTPFFGAVTQSLTTNFSLGVTATDPDVNAQLVARLYLRDGDTYSKFSSQDTTGLPLTPITGDPTTHRVEFNPFTYCDLVHNQGTPYLLYIFVADQPFQPSPAQPTDLPPNQFTKGQFDYKTWMLTCS
jgi:hypothetical protein